MLAGSAAAFARRGCRAGGRRGPRPLGPGGRSTAPSPASAAGGAGRVVRPGAVTVATAILGRARQAPHDEIGRLRAAIASGASVIQAFAALAADDGPWARPAGEVVRACSRGRSVQTVLDDWAASARDPAVDLAVDALAIGAATGGSHAIGLQVAAEALQQRRALEGEVHALAAPARASALLLVVTPLGFAGAVALLDRRVAAHIVSPAGLITVVAGLLLDAAGAAWMAMLVRRSS